MIRREAKALGHIRYFTGKPCKHGHLSERFTSTGGCVACLSQHNTSERQIEIKKKSREKYQQVENAKARMRYSPEASAIRKKEAKIKDPEKFRQRDRVWRKNNKPHLAAKSARRRALKMQAMPPWLTDEQRQEISLFYFQCPKGWHVDHIYPLVGKNSCGLHVPWNLVLLPAWVNHRKWNHVPSPEQAERLLGISKLLLAQEYSSQSSLASSNSHT
jgi:hypothetical protein